MRGAEGVGTVSSMIEYLESIDGCEGMLGLNTAGLTVKDGGMIGNGEEFE